MWYQIFPERFRNGDPDNDPKLRDIKGAYPNDLTPPWQIHPWKSDWYELQPYEQKNGKDRHFNIQRRRYGGDLQGIIDKLDYLKELGIGALYLNPVFASPSSHKYDSLLYHHIDPTFGPDPESDWQLIKKETPHDPATWVWTFADKLALRLIEEVHKRDMRIIFDGVFNHMGQNSFAFKDLVKKQKNSIYKDWFKVTSWDNPEVRSKFEYKGWLGVPELPEFKQDEHGIVDGPRDYIFAATRRWMDPQDNGGVHYGIDGWRLDVAFCVAHPFWKYWRILVKTINPQAYITAEVIDKIEVVKTYVQGDEFDAVMNYNYAFIAAEYFISDITRITTSEFDKKLREIKAAFPKDVNYVMQNLFGSHDTDRLASHIVNRDKIRYGNWAAFLEYSRAENTSYDVRKPTVEEYNIQKLFAIFQMTYLGAPMIYYGDEVGMWGANDPCCRKPMLWEDYKYDDEYYLYDGTKRENGDKVVVNRDLLSHYKKLIKIRNSLPALQLGDYQTHLTDDKKEVYSYSRNYEGETIVVILNNKNKPQQIEVSVYGKKYVDILNNNKKYEIKFKKIQITLKDKWGAILLKQPTLS